MHQADTLEKAQLDTCPGDGDSAVSRNEILHLQQMRSETLSISPAKMQFCHGLPSGVICFAEHAHPCCVPRQPSDTSEWIPTRIGFRTSSDDAERYVTVHVCCCTAPNKKFRVDKSSCPVAIWKIDHHPERTGMHGWGKTVDLRTR